MISPPQGNYTSLAQAFVIRETTTYKLDISCNSRMRIQYSPLSLDKQTRNYTTLATPRALADLTSVKLLSTLINRINFSCSMA